MAEVVNRKECIAIIPARGGSKRVPGKNRRMIAGKPMIAYAIKAALKSNLFDQVVVSTDDSVIADIAIEFGAVVPFMRTPNLADDHTPVSAATIDMLDKMDPDRNRYKWVVQLMANCPLSTAEDIQASFKAFVDSGSATQISVTPYGWQNPWWAMKLENGDQIAPLFPEELKKRSQDLPPLYCPTGAIWWGQRDVLLEQRTFHVAGRAGWVMDWQRGFDIDTEEDFYVAEMMLMKDT